MTEVMNTQEDTEVAETDPTAEVAADPKQVTITAQNPTTEEMAALREAIAISYDFSVDVKPVKFNFKKQTDKDTGVETIREAVELAVPYPSIEGIVAIIEAGGNQLELLFDAMADVVNSQARDIIADDTAINAANFPVDKLAWKFIADLPKAQRRGGGIPKETWEEFVVDYIKVMPEATGKTKEQVTNMSKILLNKLAQVKTNEPVLNMVVEQLAIYADKSPNVEDYKECLEFLLKKADSFLNVSPEELLAAL
jgi:hypothetical protein